MHRTMQKNWPEKEPTGQTGHEALYVTEGKYKFLLHLPAVSHHDNYMNKLA